MDRCKYILYKITKEKITVKINQYFIRNVFLPLTLEEPTSNEVNNHDKKLKKIYKRNV